MTDSEANHELLISVSGKVDSVAVSLEKLAIHSAAEFEKIRKHTEERDHRQSLALQQTADRLSLSIATVAERQNNSGKLNIPAIVSVCVLIGSIAVAFITPIKADIDRHAHSSDLLAQAVIVKEEKIQGLLTADSEFREKQKAMREKLDDIATNGSTLARERLAVIENDLRWMRGEKTHRP